MRAARMMGEKGTHEGYRGSEEGVWDEVGIRDEC